jgi:succinate-acetate transporter protein
MSVSTVEVHGPGNSTLDATPAQIYLQPIAAPSILGLFGFAGATFIVAGHMAHWYGGANTDLYLAAFAATFGGLAQFMAGMWAFKARDAVATAMHGMWGAFWIAYGILQYQFVSGELHRPTGAFPALGYWFIVLAAITWMGSWAASAENKVVASVLLFFAGGSTLAAIGELADLRDSASSRGISSSFLPSWLGMRQAR